MSNKTFTIGNFIVLSLPLCAGYGGIVYWASKDEAVREMGIPGVETSLRIIQESRQAVEPWTNFLKEKLKRNDLRLKNDLKKGDAPAMVFLPDETVEIVPYEETNDSQEKGKEIKDLISTDEILLKQDKKENVPSTEDTKNNFSEQIIRIQESHRLEIEAMKKEFEKQLKEKLELQKAKLVLEQKMEMNNDQRLETLAELESTLAEVCLKLDNLERTSSHKLEIVKNVLLDDLKKPVDKYDDLLDLVSKMECSESKTLLHEFNELKPELLRASLIPQSGSIFSHITAALLSPLLLSTKFPPVNSNLDRVMRIIEFVERDDLFYAVKEAGQMSGWSRLMIEEWRLKCLSHLAWKMRKNILDAVMLYELA